MYDNKQYHLLIIILNNSSDLSMYFDMSPDLFYMYVCVYIYMSVCSVPTKTIHIDW